MRGSRLDLTGQRFGKLLVIRPCGKQGTNVLWLCQCDCGRISMPKATALNKDKAKSCGCMFTRKTHGMRGSWRKGIPGDPVYITWRAMKARCNNPESVAYKNYGGRGIKICKEWVDDFQAFYDYMGPRSITESIDRIDNDGNYEPDNVRWVSKSDNTKKMHTDNK